MNYLQQILNRVATLRDVKGLFWEVQFNPRCVTAIEIAETTVTLMPRLVVAFAAVCPWTY